MSDINNEGEKNRRILIIDDNESIHQDFRNILRPPRDISDDLASSKAGLLDDDAAPVQRNDTFLVDSAHQGQEGLEMVRKAVEKGQPYSMAFVDMRMPPGWNGLDTIAHIWKEYADLQVVICTAYSDHSWDEIVERLGCTDQLLILKKPFDNVEVRQLVYALTEKWHLAQKAKLKTQELMGMVNSRTRDLEAAHQELLGINDRLVAAKRSAEEANRSKSIFLANMSHEIRTPMTAIIGYTEYIREEDSQNNMPPERISALDTILRNGKHLMTIINDILEISKIEAGKLNLEPVKCTVSSILNDIMAVMHIRAGEKGIYLTSDFTGLIPETINTDPNRLRQILINLIGNAIKFTSRGGVHLNIKYLDKDPDNPKMQFDVIDSGIGLSKEQCERLFQPFTQADNTTNRDFGGTGLGLVISRRLANLLDGDVVIAKSEINKGSTFRATIATGPLDDAKMITPNVETGTIDNNRQRRESSKTELSINCRILLAEDFLENQRLISLILQKAGVDVTVADNGKIAYDLALEALEQGKPFDVILMDMQMPELNGYDATRRLREEGYTAPIIAMTAYAMPEDREKCLQAGCDEYITKPICREGLLNTVQNYVKHNQSEKRKVCPDA
ncbi:MAG: response regulator [Pirellulales bacterium]|nr:response regulator [Pirellulales bacterium]